MLINRNKILKILVRMVITVIVTTLILTSFSYLYGRLNYKYHFNPDWRYELANRFGDLFQTIFFVFTILFAVYYLMLLAFSNALKNTKKRLLFFLSLSFIVFLLFMSTWGRPFAGLNFLDTLLACLKLLLLGLIVFFVDYLTMKFLNKIKI